MKRDSAGVQALSLSKKHCLSEAIFNLVTDYKTKTLQRRKARERRRCDEEPERL